MKMKIITTETVLGIVAKSPQLGKVTPGVGT